MAKRKALSLKTRYEIFKRDRFKCIYCGSGPETSILEVDHIIPIAKNGTNDLQNLVTACFNCNRGKGARSLSVLPKSIEIDKERIRQYKEYVKYQKDLIKYKNSLIDVVCSEYDNIFEGYTPNESFRMTIEQFIEKIGVDEARIAMQKACIKMQYKPHNVLKYFCGICWNIYYNR